MLLYELSDRIQLCPVESSRPFQGRGIQPEFRNPVLASHMNMRRFTAVKGDEEKTICTYSHNRRHVSTTEILSLCQNRLQFLPRNIPPAPPWLSGLTGRAFSARVHRRIRLLCKDSNQNQSIPLKSRRVEAIALIKVAKAMTALQRFKALVFLS
jgi:hypothetical protein